MAFVSSTRRPTVTTRYFLRPGHWRHVSAQAAGGAIRRNRNQRVYVTASEIIRHDVIAIEEARAAININQPGPA